MTVVRKTDPTPHHEVEINSERLVFDCAGSLFWPEENILVFSDLHLEKGSSFARRGQLVPPYDTGATLQQMAKQISFWNPARVISLGDSFHDDDAASRLPLLYLNQLTALTANRDWVWISGNHDPSPPENIRGECYEELSIGNLIFRHEPALKNTGKACGEVAGHLHPAGKIRRRSKSVRRRCFIEDKERLIMPSFGAFTGGLNVRDTAYDGIFDWENVQAHMIGRDRIYPIEGSHLVR